MKTLDRAVVLLVVFAVLIVAHPATSQIPDEFTNLKVLPEDIGKRQLVDIMKQFTAALGKRCTYCHVGEEGAPLSTFDFASDDKEEKRIARVMMNMTSEINGTWVAKLEHPNPVRVRCVTCHRGVNEPETIDNVVMESIEKDGLESALDHYRALRKDYYGTAAYDFSSGPLNSVAERLAAEHDDVDGAIAVMQMNIELNPGEAFPYLVLAQLYQQKGDKDAAVAAVQKSLEIDPDNQWAKRLLDKINASE